MNDFLTIKIGNLIAFLALARAPADSNHEAATSKNMLAIANLPFLGIDISLLFHIMPFGA